MPDFDKLFRGTAGRPVHYKDMFLYRADCIKADAESQFAIVFESTRSDWLQGIGITTDGTINANGNIFSKAIVLWENTAPTVVDFTIQSKKGEFWVHNVWDAGNGVLNAWVGGAAMILEELDHGRRYRCNDGRSDDDFDDLVFRLEWTTKLL